jgi:hypothetical protein
MGLTVPSVGGRPAPVAFAKEPTSGAKGGRGSTLPPVRAIANFRGIILFPCVLGKKVLVCMFSQLVGKDVNGYPIPET